METKIDNLLEQLTLAEKASLLAGADMWHTVPIPRLDIPAMKVSDGPNGVRGVGGDAGVPSVCFPVGSALGATWNTALVEEVGVALAEECHSKGAHILLAPTVNIHRTPLAGRNFECYAEDPYLSGKTAAAYIRGVQSQGVGTCIKHFVCNDSEFERHSLSSEVTERPLHEIYLEPFRIALTEAQPWSLMSAYNRINGTHASEHPYLLGELLKGKWGFDGLVISDWYGTYSDQVPAGGLDLEMPGAARWMDPEKVVAAVESGTLDTAVIDDKVRRLLRTFERVGLFDKPAAGPEQGIDLPHHRALARRAAAEAIVLLKNDGDLLPLAAAKVRSIAVIGQNAQQAQIMGGGSSAVTPHYTVSPLDGIRQRAGADVQVSYALGCPIHRSVPSIQPGWLANAAGERAGVTVSYFRNTTLSEEPVHVEQIQKTDLSWFGDSAAHIDPNHFSLRMSGALRVPVTDNYTISLSSVGLSRFSLDGAERINLWADRPADTPYEEQLERQIEVRLEADRPYPFQVEYASVEEARWRTVHLGCMPALPADPIQEAVDLASQADVAIIIAGLTGEWESEGFDRPDLRLVGQQDELIARVAAANPNTIVALNVGSPVEMPWLDDVPALLQMWYPGQEAGNALADILFGDMTPSGKLPTTFPRRLADNPAHINFPGENGKVLYGEGLFVGYRYYDQKEIEPLFPFGFGLSYTTFAYDNLTITPTAEQVEVSVAVTNSGECPGQETVQLYLRDAASRLVRPNKELKAFTKVDLAPGETKTVRFTLSPQSLAYYDPAQAAWVTEPGEFTILVGSSSRDIRLQGAFTWHETASAAAHTSALHTGLHLRVLLADAGARAVLEAHLGELLDNPQLPMALGMSLQAISGFVPQLLTAEKLQAIAADLEKL